MKWVPIVVAIIVIAIWCLPAAWFSNKAADKGYSRGAWFFITLILGPLGWIISAALVDESTKSRMLELERRVSELQRGHQKIAATVAVNDNDAKPYVEPEVDHSGDWVCKHCGKQNRVTDQYCRDCGKYKEVGFRAHVQ